MDPPDDVREHTAYKIFTEDGHLLQTVKNRFAPWSEEPASVQLPPGQYRIEAQANGYRKVIVPVVIAVGRVTTVHLDGDTSGSDLADLDSSSSVRLPDGVIVGRKAAEQNAPSSASH